jgi:hypothetical protein
LGVNESRLGWTMNSRHCGKIPCVSRFRVSCAIRGARMRTRGRPVIEVVSDGLLVTLFRCERREWYWNPTFSSGPHGHGILSTHSPTIKVHAAALALARSRLSARAGFPTALNGLL